MNVVISAVLTFAALVLLTCRCVIKLTRAVGLHSDIKRGQALTVSARIVYRWLTPSRGGYIGTTYAKAIYSVNGTESAAWMVCASSRQLSKNERVTVVTGKNARRVFAFDRKQSRDAVMTYAVFSALSFAALALLAVTVMALL
ncbi:MAG: hypothetical protein NC299_04315 [Lachnospiraceae bacterium]|nr:hypothetical protein [Ruminococcus sp.]MCM1274572.1 hypothetical protein [Lachnospiraceae bacterium]